MTVKKRITLLVAASGLLASLLFSVVIFYELIEQPFDLLDTELKEEADRAFDTIEKLGQGAGEDAIHAALQKVVSPWPNWLKIYEKDSGRVLYESKLASLIELPGVEHGSTAIVKAVVPPDRIDIGQGLSPEVPFRVRGFSDTLFGVELEMRIGLPMIKLKEEIQELILGIVGGLTLSSLALILISHFVAGRILRPIGVMGGLAHDISEKNLDVRIPVGSGSDEFNELAKTINRMLDRLQYSFVRQRDFLFDTSHELKTPLTTMRLAVGEILSSEDMDSLPPLSRENLLRLNDQVLRMERLVKDLLNLSSLETLTTIEPKVVSMTGLLSSLVSEYRYLADSQNIRMNVHLPSELLIQGEHEMLHRAFSNILDNALKYNVRGGRVDVAAEAGDVDLTITVANTGPGVTKSEIPKVFQQFYRAEKSRSTEYGGSGLGLAMVKRIVELHGGSVGFDSDVGRLTTVTIRLPLKQ